MTKDNIPPILDVGGVLISSELLTECFHRIDLFMGVFAFFGLDD